MTPTERTPVGIYFGEQSGKTVPDPYFGGEGPDRTGCHLCGRCMVGCVHGAKNTLVKNYLYFAEKLRRPGGARSGRSSTSARWAPPTAREGYKVESVRSGAWLRRNAASSEPVASSSPQARSAPTAASALPAGGSLPRISSRAGRAGPDQLASRS